MTPSPPEPHWRVRPATSSAAHRSRQRRAGRSAYIRRCAQRRRLHGRERVSFQRAPGAGRRREFSTARIRWRGSPHLVFAGHTDVVPPGRRERPGRQPRRSVHRTSWTACCMAAAAADMKGGPIRCKVAAVLDYLAAGLHAQGAAIFVLSHLPGDGRRRRPSTGTVQGFSNGRPRTAEKFDHCILGGAHQSGCARRHDQDRPGRGFAQRHADRHRHAPDTWPIRRWPTIRCAGSSSLMMSAPDGDGRRSTAGPKPRHFDPSQSRIHVPSMSATRTVQTSSRAEGRRGRASISATTTATRRESLKGIDRDAGGRRRQAACAWRIRVGAFQRGCLPHPAGPPSSIWWRGTIKGRHRAHARRCRPRGRHVRTAPPSSRSTAPVIEFGLAKPDPCTRSTSGSRAADLVNPDGDLPGAILERYF